MAKEPELTGEERRSLPGHRRIQCVVVTPEKTLLDEQVDFLAVPLFDGELGVLPGRSPLIARLGFGELRTKVDETVKRYFLDGGFVQIRDDVVTVLTNRAVPAEAIDPAAVARDLEKVQETRALNDHDYDEKAKSVIRTRGMLRVARHKG